MKKRFSFKDIARVMFAFVMLAIFTLSPVFAENKIEEVYIVPMSHCDIGFTDSLDVCAMRYKDNIDQAIILCEKHDDFYWTIESLWQLEQWMLRSSDEDVLRLKKLVDAGRIEIAAMYGNLRSGLLGIEDSNRLLYPLQRMKERLEFECVTAIQNDVPGYADVYPRVMADAGVKYFLAGVNLGHGGGATIPISEMPFMWESKNGNGVLTWIDYDGYVAMWPWGVFDIWNPQKGALYEEGKAFLDNIAKVENAGYPWSAFLLSGAMGDNVQPDKIIPVIEGVKKWNEEGRKPHIRFATPRQFFAEIERQRDDKAATSYKGHWHGLWDARLWNPAGNILGRFAQQLLPAAETIAACNSLWNDSTYYNYDLAKAFTNHLLHVEHTCAGDPSWIGWFNPSIFKYTALAQNEMTIRFAKDALFGAERVIRVNMSEMAMDLKSDGEGILVFNSLQWKRNAWVDCPIPVGTANKKFVIIDPETKQQIPYILKRNGAAVIFCAANLPAMGYKWYALNMPPEGKSLKDGDVVTHAGHIIENEHYRIECDPNSGIITSILDRAANREIVDDKAEDKMGALIVSLHHEMWDSAKGKNLDAQCSVRVEEGGFYKRLVIDRGDTQWPLTILALPADAKRIDIKHVLNRDKFRNVPGKEHSDYYNFAFPFAIDGVGLSIYVDGPDGFYAWPGDYLPGAYLGAIQSQYGIHLQDSDKFGITLANRQSFNWTVSDLNFHRRATDVDEPIPGSWGAWNQIKPKGVEPVTPKMYSNAVQHATEGYTADNGQTHFDEIEPGTNSIMTFDYSLTTQSGKFVPSTATRFCREAVVAPLALYDGGKRNLNEREAPIMSKNFISVEPVNVLVTTFKKAEFGDRDAYILRFKEVDGRGVDAVITIDAAFESAIECGLNELALADKSELAINPLKVKLNAHDVATIRIKFK
jgi:hypothetical protein